jgi:hypothetical protein
MTRQDKRSQGSTQDKETIQDQTRQDKKRHHKTAQDKEMIQDQTRQETRQDKE